MTRQFIFFFLLPIAFASYCGKSGVPYSFEVLPSGAPVLGCAQPSCVVSPEDFEEDSEFLTDAEGQADGFFREGDRNQKRFRHASAPKLVAVRLNVHIRFKVSFLELHWRIQSVILPKKKSMGRRNRIY